MNFRCLQEYSTNLGQVVDIVVSHQGLPLKVSLVAQLMSALVLPAPEHYRPLLRRFAALGEFQSLLNSAVESGDGQGAAKLAEPVFNRVKTGKTSGQQATQEADPSLSQAVEKLEVFVKNASLLIKSHCRQAAP